MIIGIDGNEANVEEKTGVHQYSYELLHACYRIRSHRKDGFSFIIYLKNSPRSDLPKEKSWWRYKIITGNRLWVLTKLLPYLIKAPKQDVFFSPHHYLPLFAPVPKVCAIHDLGYLDFSEHLKLYDFWQLKIWSAISIIVSKYIITFSKS